MGKKQFIFTPSPTHFGQLSHLDIPPKRLLPFCIHMSRTAKMSCFYEIVRRLPQE